MGAVLELKCAQCGRELLPRSTSAVAPGDVFETVNDITRIYDWRGSGSGTLCTVSKGTLITAVDQFPPGFWKVAIQSGRFRAVADPELILYPDLDSSDYVLVGGTCPEHLLAITTKLRQATEWWRR